MIAEKGPAVKPLAHRSGYFCNNRGRSPHGPLKTGA